MSQPAPNPPPSPRPPAEPRRNRLSIGHLMLWTLGSAIILAGFRLFRQQPPADSGRIDAILSVFYLGYSLPIGAQVGSVLMWVLRRVRGQRGFPVQPGHWVLLVEGLAHLLGWIGFACCILIARLRGQEVPVASGWWLAIQGPLLIVSLIGYGLALSLLRGEQGIWKIAILCLFAQQALVLLMVGLVLVSALLDARQAPSVLALYRPLQLQQSCCNPASAVLVLIAGISDLAYRRSQRDYLHWAGVGSVLLVTALQISLTWVMTWVMQYT